MDHFSSEVRSRIMAAVRSHGNRTTELVLGRLLWAAGIRGYRKQWHVAGHPDFAWPGLKIALFVDGCFWHGCRCKTIPKANRGFWLEKIVNNRRRDVRVSKQLRRLGWSVLRIKECAVTRPSTLKRIMAAIRSGRTETLTNMR